jgi:hypothetical protein
MTYDIAYSDTVWCEVVASKYRTVKQETETWRECYIRLRYYNCIGCGEPITEGDGYRVCTLANRLYHDPRCLDPVDNAAFMLLDGKQLNLLYPENAHLIKKLHYPTVKVILGVNATFLYQYQNSLLKWRRNMRS